MHEEHLRKLEEEAYHKQETESDSDGQHTGDDTVEAGKR